MLQITVFACIVISGGARGHPDEGAAFPDGGGRGWDTKGRRGMGRKLAVLLHLDSLG